MRFFEFLTPGDLTRFLVIFTFLNISYSANFSYCFDFERFDGIFDFLTPGDLTGVFVSRKEGINMYLTNSANLTILCRFYFGRSFRPKSDFVR